jgi:hypothetical protein
LSFFDEDDEPRTRVRPRRSAPQRAAGAPDRQTMLIRQVVLFGGIIVVVILLFLLVRGCRNSAAENALKDYNRAVGSLVSDSDTQVGKPFFDVLRNPGNGDIRNQVAGFKAQADQQYQQAKKISTPGDMEAAQRSFLITMEQRRDGLQAIADRISTALGSDPDAADKAINEMAGAMQMFLASDVLYTTRTQKFIQDALDSKEIGGQRIQRTQFFPGIQWLDPNTVADALGQQLSAEGAEGSGGREPAPGLHGTGIDSVQVGDLTLQPGSPNRIPYGPDTEFTVNFTNQGENDEVDIDVVLKIEGGPKTIRVTDNVASVAAGETASATLALDQAPPLDTPVTISVEVKAVPGEEKTDNNKAEYEAAFLQQ